MKKEAFFKWLKPVIAGLALLVLCAFARGLFKRGDAQYVFRILSDCFVLPGFVLSGIAAISWAGSEGTFDMLAYGSKSFLSLFSKSIASELPKSYYDYKQRKQETSRGWLKRTLAVGLCFLAIGLLLLIPYALAG